MASSIEEATFESLHGGLKSLPTSREALLAVHKLMAADLAIRARTDLEGAAQQIPGFTTFTSRTLQLLKKDLSPKVVASLDKISKERSCTDHCDQGYDMRRMLWHNYVM